MALVIINFFVNLDIKDYKRVFKDCDFTSSLMAESLIDALIEQMRIKMEFDNLTYSIIQDTVMDQMKKNETVKDISARLNGYICPHLADARKMILGKAPWASSFI
jgi:signal-transduction protein with cAMP-binding, CBS, and nucleotidyltransferase domain